MNFHNFFKNKIKLIRVNNLLFLSSNSELVNLIIIIFQIIQFHIKFKINKLDLAETGVLPSWARSEVRRFPAELGLKPDRGVRSRPTPIDCFGVNMTQQIFHVQNKLKI